MIVVGRFCPSLSTPKWVLCQRKGKPPDVSRNGTLRTPATCSLAAEGGGSEECSFPISEEAIYACGGAHGRVDDLPASGFPSHNTLSERREEYDESDSRHDICDDQAPTYRNGDGDGRPTNYNEDDVTWNSSLCQPSLRRGTGVRPYARSHRSGDTSGWHL